MPKKKSSWSLDDAGRAYLIDRWGAGYFEIDDQGRLAVLPRQEAGAAIPLTEIIEEAASRGIPAPFVIRFQDILRHRVESINGFFSEAIAEAEFKGSYRGVFPIKVNHLREVVEEIMDAGAAFHFGIEVGSKPELIAALALHEDKKSLLICNGYKDEEFIKLALSGILLGKEVILVVEKLEELQRILAISAQVGIRPGIGIRIRLQTKGEGKWAMSGGEDAKFGLSTTELIEATRLLAAAESQDCLRLVHFHVGSQISNIATVGQAVREITRYYAKLHKMGFPVRYIDVGGGLAVDYDGSRSTSESSMNYTLGEYARKVVYTISEVCDEEGVPHPDIVSESGRAIVAHHSVLVVEAFGAVRKQHQPPEPPVEGDHKLVHDIAEAAHDLTRQNRRETLHEANRIKAEAASRFELGILELADKAKIESYFWHIAAQVVAAFNPTKRMPPEVAELRNQLGDQYLCNFSVFQSLIDYWAVGQLFPIMPLHRLNEKPENEVSLVDITCDSDGKINRFVSDGALRRTLPLHSIGSTPYYLGVFLVGAYQDVMGDIHNLFGPVPEVHIFLDEDEPSGFYIEEAIPGITIEEVLRDVQYEPRQLVRLLKKQIDKSIKNDDIKPSKGMAMLRDYEKLMGRSTYLNLH